MDLNIRGLNTYVTIPSVDSEHYVPVNWHISKLNYLFLIAIEHTLKENHIRTLVCVCYFNFTPRFINFTNTADKLTTYIKYIRLYTIIHRLKLMYIKICFNKISCNIDMMYLSKSLIELKRCRVLGKQVYIIKCVYI